MPNPYIDDDWPPDNGNQDTRPASGSVPWLSIALIIAVAGIFLPPAGGWQTLPIPPFVEPSPVVNPADTLGSWVIVVEETSQRTPAIANVLGNTTYWLGLSERGLKWRFYDADSEQANAYRKLAEEVGMPAVLILGSSEKLAGKVLAKFPLPDTNAAVDAKIKEATGR